MDLFNLDGKRSTQSILPLLAMFFVGAMGRPRLIDKELDQHNSNASKQHDMEV
jgi:hypothetical protein